MPENFEERATPQFDIGRYLALVRRRHIHFLIPLFLGWLLVWGASWVLPARYKSTTTILVEQPTMPKNYVTPNISDDLQSRLQSIQQQILSPTRLLLIVDKLRLYSDPRHPLSADAKVGHMSKDIDIETVRDPGTFEITGFSVSYSAPTPALAQRVTGELTNLFINENLKERQEESQATTSFIEQQLADARQSLAEQDAKVRQFQAAHEGELPDQEASNLQILSGFQAQLQNEQDALNAAKQQRVYNQSLVEQYRTLHASSHISNSSPTGLAAIDEQLDKMRAQLADLSTRYTDQYPAVLNLKSQIAKTEKTREALVAELKARANAPKQTSASTDEPDDPGQSGPLLQLQSQLQANQIEITNREGAIASLKSRIDSYQARLNAEPANQQQLADLTRGYDQSKSIYDDLLKKENESAMATNMEQMQQGERFSQLDPPNLPLKPDFPNRLKFCGAGLGVGLVLGVLIAGGLEFLDDRLHSEEEIVKIVPFAIVSEIPEILSPVDEERNKRKLVLGWALAAIVFVTILAGSAFSFLHA
jgi:succinoglycan biosynthesis transport protein ExoP